MNACPLPKLSVVIPTCRRPDFLARCLESLDLKRQKADPALYEIVVTDDGRADTAEALIQSRFPTVRWVQGPTRGPASNRNCGANAAKGEWIAFIDDDCVASEDWISSLLKTMEDESLDVIEGKTVIPDPIDNPFYHAVENMQGGAYWSCNLAFRRQRFLSIGGFDEDFSYAVAEDMELAHRFTKSKFQVRFCPEVVVYHPMRPGTFLSTCRRVFFVRWYVLYQYKTHSGLNTEQPVLGNVLKGLLAEILNTLRRSWQDLKNFDFKNWRSSTFRVLFRVFSTPIALTCFVYWAYRYHGILNARSAPAAA